MLTLSTGNLWSEVSLIYQILEQVRVSGRITDMLSPWAVT